MIGRRLVPLLVADGHQVIGLTRTPGNVDLLGELGAEPVLGDVYDAAGLVEAVTTAAPELVMHQLTDLPDDRASIPAFSAANLRIRTEGTANLLAAARAADATRFVAQSIAWPLPGPAGEAMARFEQMVLDAPGVVVRYGQFYGPDTFHQDALPDRPRVHVDDAAIRTIAALHAPPGILTIVDD